MDAKYWIIIARWNALSDPESSSNTVTGIYYSGLSQPCSLSEAIWGGDISVESVNVYWRIAIYLNEKNDCSPCYNRMKIILIDFCWRRTREFLWMWEVARSVPTGETTRIDKSMTMVYRRQYSTVPSAEREYRDSMGVVRICKRRSSWGEKR